MTIVSNSSGFHPSSVPVGLSRVRRYRGTGHRAGDTHKQDTQVRGGFSISGTDLLQNRTLKVVVAANAKATPILYWRATSLYTCMMKLLSFVSYCWGVLGLFASHALAFQVRQLSTAASPASSFRSSSSLCASPAAATVVNIEENTGRDVGAMEEWANACGVQQVEGFQLNSEDGGMEWNVMTTQPLAEGSPVLMVPSEMIVSSTRVRDEFGDAVEAAVDQLRRLGAEDQVPQFYLFIKILTMYEMGDQSPWFPWLNSLPRLYFNAVSMTSKNQ